MYHGHVVPGFPQHPHRGFETVTIVRQGFVDHSDSLGAAARYGSGDVQWLTAGRGVVHSEMFPLLDPHFSMFWSDKVPTYVEGGKTEITIVAGAVNGTRAPSPPPKSWAANPDSDVAIWTVKMAPGARWTIASGAPGTNRSLYFFRGTSIAVNEEQVTKHSAIHLEDQTQISLQNGPAEAELLFLQGRPIDEPVVQYGPFVMN